MHEFSKNLEQFRTYVKECYGKNATLAADEGVHISVYFREHPEFRGYIRIELAVDTLEDIIELRRTQTIQWLEDRRKWLDEFQGTSPWDSCYNFREYILELRQGGRSGKEIADALNRMIAEHLHRQYRVNQIMKRNSREEPEQLLNLLIEQEGSIMPIRSAWPLIHCMKVSDEEWSQWRDDGIKNIQEGQHPIFPPEKPIDRNRVNNRIREWESQNQ